MKLNETYHRIDFVGRRRGWTVTEERPAQPATDLLDFPSQALWVAERGNLQVRVEFSRGGAVYYAWVCERVRPRGRFEILTHVDRGKAATVLGWLTEPAPGSRRSTSNSNTRGSSTQRRRRREWLVTEFGDGLHVACHMQLSPRCLWVMDASNVSPERVVPGVDGGTYERSNIIPGCGPCQREQGGRMGAARRHRNRVLTPMEAVG